MAPAKAKGRRTPRQRERERSERLYYCMRRLAVVGLVVVGGGGLLLLFVVEWRGVVVRRWRRRSQLSSPQRTNEHERTNLIERGEQTEQKRDIGLVIIEIRLRGTGSKWASTLQPAILACVAMATYCHSLWYRTYIL